MWQQILENLNMINTIVAAVTVPYTVITGFIFAFRRCKRHLRRRGLKKLLGYEEVVIHIPTRIAENSLGESRLKPVVAEEDYNTYEQLRDMLLQHGFRVVLSYIPARNDDLETYGELEVRPNVANIVVCGPKNSRTVERIFSELEGLDFVKGEDGWYFDDLISNVQMSSPLTENMNQYAFMGKVEANGGRILLICGIHAIGSDGVAYFLGDSDRLAKLLNFIQDKNFYCIVRSAYSYAEKKIYNAELTHCKRILDREGGIL